MPEELIEKKLELRGLNEALGTLRQLFLATFDFVVHSETEKSKGIYDHGLIAAARKAIHHKDNGNIDTGALWAWIKPKMTFIEQTKDTNPAASFGHILGGYESRYYGYQWSLVYSTDLFTEFQKNGIMNKEVGMKYRKKILAPGGTKSGM